MRTRHDDYPLYGWTFHQSHDQATVLFLIPQSVSASDVDIRIANDHVSASIPNHPPILQAKLYGRVNTETSTWRIADRDRARTRRSRSLVRSSMPNATTPTSGSEDMTDPHSSLPSPPRSHTVAPSETASTGSHVRVESSPTSQSSLSASIVSLRSGSSYEVLSHPSASTLPLVSAANSTESYSGSSDLGSSDSAETNLNQSVVLSDPGDVRRRTRDIDPRAQSTSDFGPRRSLSIPDLAASSSSASLARASTQAARDFRPPPRNGPPQVRLVTVHLDKTDNGIWPLLVVGPAPLQVTTLPARLVRLLENELPRNGCITESFIYDRIQERRGLRREQQQRSAAQLQLNQALEEALSAFEGGDRVLAAIRTGADPTAYHSLARSRLDEGSRNSMDSDEDFGPNTSTLSINTIGSDESNTVLGSRVATLSGTSADLYRAHATLANALEPEVERQEDDEVLEAWKELKVMARYNMDPTTLSLIGLQVANGPDTMRGTSLAVQLTRGPSTGISDGFEYFARAWRAADVSLATERLVQDFLPLLPSTSHGAGPQDLGPLHARLSDVLDPSLVARAASLPLTAEAIADSLRELQNSHSYMSLRQRLVASLGGPKALARLYASYAKLHLPSLASNRSPLAFPYGQLTSPFVSGVDAGTHPAVYPPRIWSRKPTSSSSSRTPSVASVPFGGVEGGATSPAKSTRAPNSPTVADTVRTIPPDPAPGQARSSYLDFSDFHMHPSSVTQPSAYYFLREAYFLDSDAASQIGPEEWAEAITLATEHEDSRRAEAFALAQAEEMGSLAGDSGSGELTFESDSEAQRRRALRRSKLRSSTNDSVGGLFNLAWLKGADAVETGRKRGGKPPRRQKNKRRKDHRMEKSRGSEEAGMINLVSGAALLGVALAGSVAALGWWRRSSGALNSSA